MSPRLSRAEQNDRNRALLLAAARRVFLERGYFAATLDQIADEAGFSKGAVAPRFASKPDMFLALLEDRISERAGQNAQLAEDLAGTGNFAAVIDLAERAERGSPGWRLLGTEFRIHAAPGPRSSTAGTRPCTRGRSTGSRRFSPRSARRAPRASRSRPGSWPSSCSPSRPAAPWSRSPTWTPSAGLTCRCCTGWRICSRGSRCRPGRDNDYRHDYRPRTTADPRVGCRPRAKSRGPRTSRLGRRAARRLPAGPAAGAAGPGHRGLALPRPAAPRRRSGPVRARRPGP